MTRIAFTAAEAKNRALRSALCDWLQGQVHTHFVTLNFHADYKPERAQSKLRIWTLDLLSRIFDKAAFAGVPTSDVLRFTAMPEFTYAGHPHYHLALWIDPSRAEYFERLAGDMWKRIVPTGTSDIQPWGPTERDNQNITGYMTKKSDRAWSNSGFITSSMLDLPKVCRKPALDGGRPVVRCVLAGNPLPAAFADIL